MNNKINIFGLTPEKLKELVTNLELPSFTAVQLTEWLYQKRVTSFSDMTNLSMQSREKLESEYCIKLDAPVKVQISTDGTKKYLFATQMGKFIETAYIPDDERATLCVSTQVGCKMGCLFCITGKQGFQGNLSSPNLTIFPYNIHTIKHIH